MRALRQQIKDAPSKDLFIFVHGFNNTFEDAARRAAQMAYDLDFDGTPVLYSWPSQGSATAYAVDEAAVGISGRKMADFLETVVARVRRRAHPLLAHSMGNRALIEALQTYLAKRAPEKRRHIFGQIVFTAPDVDRDYFIGRDRFAARLRRAGHAVRFRQRLCASHLAIRAWRAARRHRRRRHRQAAGSRYDRHVGRVRPMPSVTAILPPIPAPFSISFGFYGAAIRRRSAAE